MNVSGLFFLCLGAVAEAKEFKPKADEPIVLPPRPRSRISTTAWSAARRTQTPIRDSCGKCCFTVEDVTGTALDQSFYAKRVNVRGFNVASSAAVSDAALLQTALIVAKMTSKRPDLLQTLINEGVHMAVIGKDEVMTDIPEYVPLGSDWNQYRGVGATRSLPVSSCAEEDVLCYGPGHDVYHNEHICPHEFAHSLAGSGCSLPTRRYAWAGQGLHRAITDIYSDSMSEGRWQNTYAGSTDEELWAEGVQAYFNVDAEGPEGGNGIHNHVNTRSELLAYEPALASLIETMFDGNQSLHCPETECDCSNFECPRVLQLPAWICAGTGQADLVDYDCNTDGSTEHSCCGEQSSALACQATLMPGPTPAPTPAPTLAPTPVPGPAVSFARDFVGGAKLLVVAGVTSLLSLT